VAGSGGEVEALPLLDAQRRRAVVELVLDPAGEDVAAVAVGAPFLTGCTGLVLDLGPALPERALRARVDVRLVVRPADRPEIEDPAGAQCPVQ
jgi:hypothetical protein